MDTVDKYLGEGKKLYYEMDNVGKAKYTVNFTDGKETHGDGSPFYGIKIFKNKKDKEGFIKLLKKDGYTEK